MGWFKKSPVENQDPFVGADEDPQTVPSKPPRLDTIYEHLHVNWRVTVGQTTVSPDWSIDELNKQIAITQEMRQDMVVTQRAISHFGDTTGPKELSGVWESYKVEVREEMLDYYHKLIDLLFLETTWRSGKKHRDKVLFADRGPNKLGSVFNAMINDEYRALVLQEYDLLKRRLEKEYEAKELMRAEQQVAREQDRLLRDIKKAEQEELKLQALLDRARAEVGSDVSAYKERVSKLEQELREAHSRLERAKSMAQLTRRGFVYVISNPGSFGDDVYKIGMTRRLNPHERVVELGDASVPFRFETHAMIYSENAPSLEQRLHRAFDEFRVNTINGRKEFFRVSIQDIKALIREEYPNAKFHEPDETSDYYLMRAGISLE